MVSPSSQSASEHRAGDGACVLVTGARGFTGAYVRAELEAAGYRVVGTVLGATAADEVSLDITSAADCRRVLEQVRPDYVVHLAAISFVHHESAEAFYQVNVIGTMNLLQAMADTQLTPRRVLIASSANVYGNAGGFLSEAQAPQPVNHYSASKLAMEHLVRTWCDRLPIVVTRPFNYTGVGQELRFLVPKIVSHFVARKPLIELGNLDVERDFSDVRVVAHAYRLLLEEPCDGEVVNVCSGKPYSLRAIIASMQQIAGYEIDVRVNPAFVRASDVRTLVGVADKLHALVGSIDTIAFEDTLRWMYDSGVMQSTSQR